MYGILTDQPSPKMLPCWLFWLLYVRSRFGCRLFLPGGITMGYVTRAAPVFLSILNWPWLKKFEATDPGPGEPDPSETIAAPCVVSFAVLALLRSEEHT